jgi:ergothioneine biosynthesis protein EgtB
MSQDLSARLRDVWRRSDALFELVRPDALFARPIALRQPFVFYLGHLPAFAWNQLCRGLLGRPSFEAAFDTLFERGIDPPDVGDYRAETAAWPAPSRIRQYRDRVRDALLPGAHAAEARGRADVVERVIEHELMHHETLLYMLLQLPHDQKRRPPSRVELGLAGAVARPAALVPGGEVVLGAPRDGRFGWDNEFPEQRTSVADFRIDALPVRNDEFLEFVAAGAYADRRLWSDEAWAWLQERGHAHPRLWSRGEGTWLQRTLFEDVPLDQVLAWPVCVTWAEAAAFARWKGRRLPTEAEYHRAAYSAPDGKAREHPWGEAAPTAEHGNFGLRHGSPTPVGTHPAGASAWGVHDLVGDGWEWTTTPFGPFPGFEPMPGYEGYSRDFFDGRHYVLLGASWASDDAFVRRSFRNWFQPHYPFVFAKFRCVDASHA